MVRIAVAAVVLAILTAASTSFAAGLSARITDKESGEPLVGTTVVATSPVLQIEVAAIVDSSGTVTFTELPAGIYAVTAYYADSMFRRTNIAVTGPGLTSIAIGFDTSQLDSFPCRFPQPAVNLTPALREESALGAALPRSLPTLAFGPRTEVRTYGLAIGDVELLARSATRNIERVRLGQRATRSARDVGTIHITPQRGDNELKTDVRAQVGSGSIAAAATSAGPIRKDRAWFLLSAAPRTTRSGSVLPIAAGVDIAAKNDHQGGLFAASELGADSSRALGIARWRSKFDNGKTELNAAIGTSTSRSAASPQPSAKSIATSNRRSQHGARLSIGHMKDLAGLHHLVAALEGVVRGSANGEPRRSASASLSDSWWLRPNMILEVGVRAQRTRAGENVMLPSAGFVYDWTKETRSRLFGSAARALTIDEQPIRQGGLGIEVELLDSVTWLTALTRRGSRNGIETAARADRDALRGQIRYGFEVDGEHDTSHRIDAYAELRILNCRCSRLWLGAVVHEGWTARGDDARALTTSDEIRGSGVRLHWELSTSGLAIGLEATRADGHLDASASVDWRW